jgi:hypothetical protein
MKKYYILVFLSFILFTNCVSKKIYSDIESKLVDLKVQNRKNEQLLLSKEEKLTQATSEIDNLNNELKKQNAKVDELEKEILTVNATGNAEEYFTDLKSSTQVKINSFFTNGESLKNVNDKLVKIIISKMNYDDGTFKYFPLSNGGYGIITEIRCIDEKGNVNSNCPNTKNCNWYHLSCIEEGLSQCILFLITKKDLDGNDIFILEEFSQQIKKGGVDSNFKTITTLKSLISDNNKYNDDYSFYIRLFEIKKKTMAAPSIIDPTYDFGKKMKELFKN